MKICLITNLYQPHIIGGAEIYVERIAAKLSENHEVTVITSVPYEGFRSLGCSYTGDNKLKVYTFYPLNLYSVLNSKQKPLFLKPLWHALDIWNMHSYFVVNKILQKEKPDIIHSHNLSGFSLSVIACAKRKHLPLVHTCHDFSLLCPYATLKCFLRRKEICLSPSAPCVIYRRLKKNIIDALPDFVIFPSHSTAEIFHRNGLFNKTQGAVLPYCIETKEPGLSAASRDSGYFNILYVGQIAEHKGVQILIRAFKELSYGNIKLHIVGGGDYLERLKRIAFGDERIKFYGKVSPERVRDFYNKADITVVPSIWPEVLGIVILESFSAGVPVVGSDTAGIAEIIKDGYNGFVFKAGRVSGLKEKLEKIIEDPGLLENLRANALQSAENFNIESHINCLNEIYKQAIDKNKRVAP